MSKSLRIALVGAWHVHADDYAGDCERNPHTTLVAVWDEDADRAKVTAAKWDVPTVSDLETLLSDPDLHGVIITTATNEHRVVMEKVIAAGKHIFTEKVLAASTEDAEAIATSATRAGVTLTVSLPRLYTGYTQAVDEILASGVLGAVSYIRVRVSHDGAVGRDGQAQWLPEHFFDRREAMGGAMIDFGAHPYYLVHHFAGLPDSVSAHYLSVSGHDVEDQALVVCHYPGTMTAVAEASFLGGAVPFQIEIHGENGSLLYDFDQGLRTRFQGDSGWTSTKLPEDRMNPFDRWVDSIQQGEMDIENVEAALALTRLAAAAEVSAAENRIVYLNEGH